MEVGRDQDGVVGPMASPVVCGLQQEFQLIEQTIIAMYITVKGTVCQYWESMQSCMVSQPVKLPSEITNVM